MEAVLLRLEHCFVSYVVRLDFGWASQVGAGASAEEGVHLGRSTIHLFGSLRFALLMAKTVGCLCCALSMTRALPASFELPLQLCNLLLLRLNRDLTASALHLASLKLSDLRPQSLAFGPRCFDYRL